jgi:hypothetical protein
MAQQAPDVDALIQAIIAAANAAAAAAVPVAIPAPPAAPAAPFALLPGAAYNAPLDYSKSGELKMFRSATTGMDDKFDLKEDHLRVFLSSIKEHVRTYDWNGIVTVPDTAAENRNLITNYGQLTMANVRAHAITYIDAQTRNAQNSMMLYLYLLNSLTEDAKLVMITMADQYHAGANNMPAGALFLKSIIGRASIDTKAKVLLLRESVSHLYMKMVELKGNVREFNQHVSDLKSALVGRGQDVSELIMRLFKAYEQVPDQQFYRYIEGIRDRYDADIEDTTAEELMQLAVNKYDLLEQRNAMPTDSMDKIVALVASAKEVKKGKNNRNRQDRPEDAWKKVPPKAGEPLTKIVNDRNYHFCPNHKAWCIHTPAECTRPPAKDDPAEVSNSAADKLVISRAYQVILHEGDSDEDE